VRVPRAVLLFLGAWALAACSGSSESPGSALCGSCGSGLTCVDNADFPGGACTKSCETATCASGSECIQLSTGQFCLPSCSSGQSCPTGLTCGPGGTKGNVCSPPASMPAAAVTCSAPTIVAGPTIGPANPPTGCQKPTIASSYAPVLPAIGQAIHMGVRNVGEQLTVQFPAGTSGFSVISQGAAANPYFQVQLASGAAANAPLPTPIGSPNNAAFFTYPDPGVNAPSDRNILWSGPLSPGFAAVTFPNTTAALAQADAGLPTGTWSFTVSDLLRECGNFSDCNDPHRGSTANVYDITVLTRSGGIPAKGALDVAIYLATTTGLKASDAPTDPDLNWVVQRFAADMARGGICLQTVTFYNLPTWAENRYAVTTVGTAAIVDPCSDYRQMFTLAQPGNTVNLFFVDQLDDSDGPPGSVTIGFDGAIPAPTTTSGTVAGGAVASMADLRMAGAACSGSFNLNCGPDVIAETAAHESGHTLGLFHPSESDGSSGDSFDGLVDTPQCVCEVCASSSTISNCLNNSGTSSNFTQVEGDVCHSGTQVCGGADYLMFWQLTGFSAGNVSPQEGQVMRMNPVVRPL